MIRVGLVLLLCCTKLCVAGELARFSVTIDNTWSEATHPGLVPEDAHFSWFGGGTHNDQTSYWEVGEVSSPGMVQMAESGVTRILVNEIANDPNAFAVIDQTHWFCPETISAPSCGPLTFEFEVDSDFPLVTLVSMLGPSPDWFVGISGLALHSGTEWEDKLSFDLFPYDAGTRSNNVFALWGPQNSPPDPITLITETSGQLITPQSLGTMTIGRVQACDLDGDFVCAASDIDLLSETIRDAGDLDLTGDGSTDELDREYWVTELVGTRFGDANLDGEVTFPDFLLLSRGFGETAGWAGGDFDGSGGVEFGDFLQLAANFGTAEDGAPIGINAVPEPRLLIWFVAIAVWCDFSFRRRSRRLPNRRLFRQTI